MSSLDKLITYYKKGRKLVPERHFGSYGDLQKACFLGAVFVGGTNINPADSSASEISDWLSDEFPFFEQQSNAPCCDWRYSSLGELLVHLNDDAAWPEHMIIDYLREVVVK